MWRCSDNDVALFCNDVALFRNDVSLFHMMWHLDWIFMDYS
jgi:hypothetical protein